MNIGIPKEIRPNEYRVGLPPAGVEMLVHRGHTCYVEHQAGLGAGFTDQEYQQAGGQIVYSALEAYGRADLVLKFARPLEEELGLMREGCTLLGWLQLPSARQSKIDALLRKKITALTYEQIQLPDGSLPVMRPLSEIGGRIAAQIAAWLLQNNAGGKGILLSGMPGVPPAEVVILGAGIVGTYAAKTLLGMGAQLTMLDSNAAALQSIHEQHPEIVTMFSTTANLKRVCSYADVLIAAAMIPGQRAPVLISREMVQYMKARAVLMDLSIDMGGCSETSRPTTHADPTFIEENVIHYCVPNIPSVVARTATHAFFNAAKPYILEIVEQGVEAAIEGNPALAKAVNTHNGELVNLSRLHQTPLMD